ncbi:MAG: acyl-CoA dehydrogenase family protein [Frankiaceae bacterium]
MGNPGTDAVDFLALDETLGEEERLVRDTVRRFVDEKFLPVVAGHFEAGTFPADLVPTIAGLGLLGMHLEGHGCAGASATAYGVACRELERGDSGLRSFVSVQGSLCMFPIHAYGTDEQMERWLPRMAAGEVIGCFGLTEPDHGSDPASMRARARRDGDDYVLSGTKRWITNAPIADLAIVWARDDDGHVGGFLVERGTPGFEVREITRKLSLRASATGELLLDDCRVPAVNRLPGARGLKAPLSCLNEARYGIAWGAVGAAVACYLSALDYMQTRTQFGRPLAAYQLSQQKLADMLTEITKAQLLACRIAELKERHRLAPVQVSMAKRNNVRAAIDIAREARAMLGANGVSLEYPVIRHMNNLESVLTYEGTEEIHALVLGEHITGHAAYR